jgi:hypothetical protein
MSRVPASVVVLFLIAIVPFSVCAITATSVPLTRNNYNQKTPNEQASWFQAQADLLKAKYDPRHKTKRQKTSSTEPLTNLDADFSYYGSISIGTPRMYLYGNPPQLPDSTIP